MAAQYYLVHHQAVHPLRHALVLDVRKQLLDHDADYAVLVLGLLKVDGDTAVQQPISDLLVGVPGRDVVTNLLLEGPPDVLLRLLLGEDPLLLQQKALKDRS